jgi:hypothetical protein
MNGAHANAISLFGRTIDTIDHSGRETAFEGFGLPRPIRISAGDHNSTIATGDSYKLLGIRFPSLNIQHTVTYVLKIDE